jgi:hypothetical protein
VPVGTVKSRCARARARLAEQLSDLDPRRPTPDDSPPTEIPRNDTTPARVQLGELNGEEPA